MIRTSVGPLRKVCPSLGPIQPSLPEFEVDAAADDVLLKRDGRGGPPQLAGSHARLPRSTNRYSTFAVQSGRKADRAGPSTRFHITDMVDRARISACRPLMAEVEGPDARRVAAQPYGVRKQGVVLAAVGPSSSEVARVGERLAGASPGERPVAWALRGEQPGAMASAGERPVAGWGVGVSPEGQVLLSPVSTAWLQATGALRRPAPPLQGLWQQTRDPYQPVHS